MRLHIHYSPVRNTSNWMAFFRTCRTMSSFKGHMSTLLRRPRWFIQPKGCRDHFWYSLRQEFMKWSPLMSKCGFILERDAVLKISVFTWFLLGIKTFSSLSSACYFPPAALHLSALQRQTRNSGILAAAAPTGAERYIVIVSLLYHYRIIIVSLS